MRMATNNFIVCGIIIACYVALDFFLLSFFAVQFFQVLIGQLLLIALAVSPVGEHILRFLFGCKLMTNREAKAVLPAFSSVYEGVKETYGLRVKLRLEDTANVNVYALGLRTIIVTRGAIEFMNEDQIRGLFAHEFGHLIRGDTIFPLVLIVGNVIFLVFMLLARMLQIAFGFLTSHGNVLFLGTIFNYIINTIVSIVLSIFQIFTAFVKRGNEYRADRFAVSKGYESDLLSALYAMMQFRREGKMKIINAFKASHPNLRNRILRIERRDYRNASFKMKRHLKKNSPTI